MRTEAQKIARVEKQKAYRATPEYRAAQAKYRATPERKAWAARYRARPERKAAAAKYNASPKGRAARARYMASPEGKRSQLKYQGSLKRKKWYRRAYFKYKYGITPEFIEAQRQIQNNLCTICEQPFDKGPHVDHNHDTGKFRGLLCGRCNRGIGHFKDDPAILHRAIKYLTKAGQERKL